MSKSKISLPRLHMVTAIAALAAFTVGAYAMLRNDLSVMIPTLTLGLMLMVISRNQDLVEHPKAANDNPHRNVFARLWPWTT